LCIGTPIAGRDQPETESLIGFFINSLAFRNDLGGDPSFTKLLQQVKTNTLEAFENKQLPFEKVGRCSRNLKEALVLALSSR
jgi:non-ribosomal peptide synthetase component F